MLESKKAFLISGQQQRNQLQENHLLIIVVVTRLRLVFGGLQPSSAHLRLIPLPLLAHLFEEDKKILRWSSA